MTENTRPEGLNGENSLDTPKKGETTMSSGEKEQKRLTRREFVKGAAIGTAGAAAAGALAGCAPTPEVIKETVEVEKVVEKEVPVEVIKEVEVTKEVEVIKEVEVKPWLPEKWDYEADVVIVGYGGAGACAAIAAHDAGAKVLILEKDTVPRGGNTGCSGGGSSIGVTVEGALNYLRAECWGTVADEELLRTYAEETLKNPIWTEQLGGKVCWKASSAWSPLLPGGGEGFADPKGSWNIEVDGQRGDGYELFKFYSGCVTARGIEVMLGTPVTELIQDGATKEILGVKALTGVTFTEDFHQEPGGKEIYVKAKKGVILACGGYENNREMHHNFSPFPHSAFVTWYGNPLNTGDGLVMAQRVGAKLWHMNKKEAHSFACVPVSKELGTGICVTAYGAKMKGYWGIYVNRDGKRFMNEYFWSGHSEQHKVYDEFEHKLSPEDDYDYSDYRNIPIYWVFDDITMKAGSLRGTYKQYVGIHKIYEWSEDNSKEVEKGWIIKADTIEELGQKIKIKDFFGRVVGMDAAGLVETVNKYNQYCAAGKDLDFGRRAETLIPISTPPFYAMEVCDCLTNTMGGPQHNKYAQTLDVDEKPIPRLYSAGELGAIFGFLYNGQNLAEAVAFGRIAGEHAAGLEPWD